MTIASLKRDVAGSAWVSIWGGWPLFRFKVLRARRESGWGSAAFERRALVKLKWLAAGQRRIATCGLQLNVRCRNPG